MAMTLSMVCGGRSEAASFESIGLLISLRLASGTQVLTGRPPVISSC